MNGVADRGGRDRPSEDSYGDRRYVRTGAPRSASWPRCPRRVGPATKPGESATPDYWHRWVLKMPTGPNPNPWRVCGWGFCSQPFHALSGTTVSDGWAGLPKRLMMPEDMPVPEIVRLALKKARPQCHNRHEKTTSTLDEVLLEKTRGVTDGHSPAPMVVAASVIEPRLNSQNQCPTTRLGVRDIFKRHESSHRSWWPAFVLRR